VYYASIYDLKKLHVANALRTYKKSKMSSDPLSSLTFFTAVGNEHKTKRLI